MTRTTFTLLVSAFLLAFVFTARAQSSLWVRPGGCDTATCGSSCNGTFECPLDTIQAALDELPYGGTVLLFPGTYSGEGNSNITLKGAQYTIKYVLDTHHEHYFGDLQSITVPGPNR